jgi:hypothetical protein
MVPYYVWASRLQWQSRVLFDKVRRDIAAWFQPDDASTRRGGCMRCGACCKILYRCPFYAERADGTGFCRIYHLRPRPCQLFPRHPRDLLSVPMCSYWFDGGGRP